MNISGIMSGIIQNLIYSLNDSSELLNRTQNIETILTNEAAKSEIAQVDKQVADILEKISAKITKQQETICALPKEEQTIMRALLNNIGPNLEKMKSGLVPLYTSLKDMAPAFLKASQPEKMKSAAFQKMTEMSSAFENQFEINISKETEHTMLSMALPIYMGEGSTVYPAHIHIYRQHANEKRTAAECETWLRIHIDTENMGRVVISLLLKNEQLDVKILADEPFREIIAGELPLLEEELKKQFKLNNIRVM